MELTIKNVNTVYRDCLFTESELDEVDTNTLVFVKGEGVLLNAGFNPERLEKHRDDVKSMLGCFESYFYESTGGGMSFLRFPLDCMGNHWGEHNNCDELITLGVALGYVELTSRKLDRLLPGGVPYVMIKDEVLEQ